MRAAPDTAADAAAEILLQGPNVFAGYWKQPAATAEAFDGGWFKTGDLGRYVRGGYLEIVGRAKELIITGGHNVYPREVEDALRTLPSVVDVAVVGEPDDEWGEVVVAYVVTGDEPAGDAGALAEHCRQTLAPYKVPRRFEFVASLPRNALGKVLKHELGAP